MVFPQMQDAFWDWTSPIIFTVVSRAVVDFEAVATPIEEVTFQGVLEPLPDRDLMIKAEGERNWMWFQLWTTQSLKNGDFLLDNYGRRFKVMKKSDWVNAGYRGYQLTQKTNEQP